MVPKIIDTDHRRVLRAMQQAPAGLGEKSQVPIVIPKMAILIKEDIGPRNKGGNAYAQRQAMRLIHIIPLT